MMGEEDIIRSIANELPISRRYNIQCISASGTLLVIKKQVRLSLNSGFPQKIQTERRHLEFNPEILQNQRHTILVKN